VRRMTGFDTKRQIARRYVTGRFWSEADMQGHVVSTASVNESCTKP
jgi:hypothetical protein